MNYYVDALKNWNVFTGRWDRKQYWMFVLINVLIAIALSILSAIIHTQIIYGLYNLVLLVPGIAAGIRRMHDTDHSGWWVIAPLINLYFACIDGTPGPNRFGEDPKARLPGQGFPVIQQQQA